MALFHQGYVEGNRSINMSSLRLLRVFLGVVDRVRYLGGQSVEHGIEPLGREGSHP